MNNFNFNTTSSLIFGKGVSQSSSTSITNKLGNNIFFITDSGITNIGLNKKIIDGINFFNWPESKDWNLTKPEMIEHKSFLKKIKIDFKPDIIHIIDLVNFRPDILDFCKSLKVPIVKHVINFEDLIVSFFFFDSFLFVLILVALFSIVLIWSIFVFSLSFDLILLVQFEQIEIG